MFSAVFLSHHGSFDVIRARRTHASPRCIFARRVDVIEFIARIVALARASVEADMTAR
jgi:hypothetical protein